MDPDEKPGAHASRNPVVSRSRIEPLPNYRANPKEHAHALFPRDAMVLALYPQTTCFYAVSFISGHGVILVQGLHPCRDGVDALEAVARSRLRPLPPVAYFVPY